MKVPRQDRQVKQIEVVETYNLYRSLERTAEKFSTLRLQRALYHALGMTELFDRDTMERIRIALRLP
jgi:hypothetical protein